VLTTPNHCQKIGGYHTPLIVYQAVHFELNTCHPILDLFVASISMDHLLYRTIEFILPGIWPNPYE
jgi:hypothetical protein